MSHGYTVWYNRSRKNNTCTSVGSVRLKNCVWFKYHLLTLTYGQSYLSGGGGEWQRAFSNGRQALNVKSRHCALTAEPFSIWVMDAEVWAKHIIYSHFLLQGKTVIFPCPEHHVTHNHTNIRYRYSVWFCIQRTPVLLLNIELNNNNYQLRHFS